MKDLTELLNPKDLNKFFDCLGFYLDQNLDLQIITQEMIDKKELSLITENNLTYVKVNNQQFAFFKQFEDIFKNF